MDPLPKDGESAAGGEPSRGAAPSSGVVVQVREKKGPLRAAIPYMPFPVAVICLFLNTFVPGLGTFVSAFTVLCGARTDLPDRHICCVFWLNIAAALIQILTAIVMVGWIMSIFWGMDMVILAISQGKFLSVPPPQPCTPGQIPASSGHLAGARSSGLAGAGAARSQLTSSRVRGVCVSVCLSPSVLWLWGTGRTLPLACSQHPQPESRVPTNSSAPIAEDA
ncbi:protein stum homolog isoform X1 [Numida meleagris]|uniref:protein stum homolog isoform X1 n=1 Tax=Numida meleagris TaxID=8996 RepID=UPI000B3D9A09|nr:protein stum homolog isoform X1 [Numida meleagris]